MTEPRGAVPRLYVGGTVLLPSPLGPAAPVDEGQEVAVATAGGRIVAVGSAEDCRSALPPVHEVVRLDGRALAPGFVDAHLHPLPMCVFEDQLDLDACPSLEWLFDALADRVRRDPDVDVLFGFQFDDERMAERRLPTATELDRASGGRQVVIVRRDGHHAIGSSAALQAAGIHEASPDPAGGRIDRDAHGRLTGLCAESAAQLLTGLLPAPTLEGLTAALDRCVARLASFGVTGITAFVQSATEGPAGAAGELEAFAWSVLVERVPFDVQTILITPDVTHALEWRGTALHDPARRRRLDGLKLFLDGTLGGHSACMHQPFADRPGSAGMLTLEPDEAFRRMVDAQDAGLIAAVHAIGDRANHTAMDLFDRLEREHGSPAPGVTARHRVEHASVLDDATVEGFARLGVATVVQPISLQSERHWLDARVGPGRRARTYPYRSLLDAGVTVAGSSDAPIESAHVLAAVEAAVTRHDFEPAQAVSVAEALAMYTSGAAAVRGLAGEVGSIAVGQRADLVVLGADPHTVAPTTIGQIEVLATIVGGTEIFRHEHLTTERRSMIEGTA